jgi:hypothetical protein
MLYAIRVATSSQFISWRCSGCPQVEFRLNYYYLVTRVSDIGVWKGVPMDSLNFHPGPLCLTLLHPARGDTPVMALVISGVVHQQDGRPAPIFYPFGHPTPYAYEHLRSSA